MKSIQIKSILGILLIIHLIVLANALTISNVQSTPEEVAPGETVKLTLEIENEIGEDVTNVAVNLDLTNVPFAPYKSSTDATLEGIDDGEDETVLFDLVALSDAESKVYKIPVAISYIIDDGSNLTTKKTSAISLSVIAKPILIVDSQANLIKGKNNQLNIEITNAGLTKAKLLTINIKDVAGIKLLGSKSVYIGDIESDDFSDATFDVFVYNDASSKINLPVELIYRDAKNQVQTDEFNLDLRAYSKDEAVQLGLIPKDNTLIYGLVIVVLLILFFGYRAIRKRRRNHRR